MKFESHWTEAFGVDFLKIKNLEVKHLERIHEAACCLPIFFRVIKSSFSESTHTTNPLFFFFNGMTRKKKKKWKERDSDFIHLWSFLGCYTMRTGVKSGNVGTLTKLLSIFGKSFFENCFSEEIFSVFSCWAWNTFLEKHLRIKMIIMLVKPNTKKLILLIIEYNISISWRSDKC